MEQLFLTLDDDDLAQLQKKQQLQSINNKQSILKEKIDQCASLLQKIKSYQIQHESLKNSKIKHQQQLQYYRQNQLKLQDQIVKLKQTLITKNQNIAYLSYHSIQFSKKMIQSTKNNNTSLLLQTELQQQKKRNTNTQLLLQTALQQQQCKNSNTQLLLQTTLSQKKEIAARFQQLQERHKNDKQKYTVKKKYLKSQIANFKSKQQAIQHKLNYLSEIVSEDSPKTQIQKLIAKIIQINK